MSELTDRLREHSYLCSEQITDGRCDCDIDERREAADEIDRLTADKTIQRYGPADATLRERVQWLVAENDALRKDAERLDWVMHMLSGKAWRDIGVVYSAGCDRAAIDAAMQEQK